MIDRGALVLGPSTSAPRYRGVHRPPLDAQVFRGKRGKQLGRRYAEAVVAGEGVLEDLDEAQALLAEAEGIGIEGLEVVVVEVPQEPAPRMAALAVAPTPPAEGLELIGYDVIELLEPYWSLLATETPPCAVNARGLVDARGEAESVAARHNASAPEDPVVAVRVWLAGRAAG